VGLQFLFTLFIFYPIFNSITSATSQKVIPKMNNRVITTEAIIKGLVRKDAAWQVISDFQNFPTLMKNVDKVVIHDRNEHEGKSEWFVTIENAPMHWLEQDIFDAPKYGMRFESIDGDFEQINGSWKVEDFHGDGIRLEYSMNYHLGIPVIEEVVGDVLQKKMKKNADSMVQAIKDELYKPAIAEERASPRIPIGLYNTFFLNGKEIRALVCNISRKGMMFAAGAGLHAGEGLFIIDGVAIGAEMLSDPVSSEKFRAIFQKEIRQDELDHLTEYFLTKNLRSYTRKLMQKDAVLKSDEKEIPVRIIDISPGGMLIGQIDFREAVEGAFTIDGVSIPPHKKDYDAWAKTLRIQYSKALSENDFVEMLTMLESAHASPVQLQMA
jgi:ribosome-associated toxin RatA of RatAB toxin-antitoxin module